MLNLRDGCEQWDRTLPTPLHSSKHTIIVSQASSAAKGVAYKISKRSGLQGTSHCMAQKWFQRGNLLASKFQKFSWRACPQMPLAVL